MCVYIYIYIYARTDPEALTLDSVPVNSILGRMAAIIKEPQRATDIYIYIYIHININMYIFLSIYLYTYIYIYTHTQGNHFYSAVCDGCAFFLLDYVRIMCGLRALIWCSMVQYGMRVLVFERRNSSREREALEFPHSGILTM